MSVISFLEINNHEQNTREYLDGAQHQASSLNSSNVSVFNDLQPLEVVDIIPQGKAEKTDEGTVWQDKYILSDDTSHDVLTGICESPRSDIPLDGSTPWGTGIKGHNRRTVQRAMSAGFVVRMIGPEMYWSHSGNVLQQAEKTIKKGLSISLGQRALNHLQILNAHDRSGHFKYSIQPGVGLWYGESEAAMTGLGVVSQASAFNRVIPHSELVEPCLPRKLELEEIPSLILSELGGFGTLAGAILFENRLRHYVRSLNISPAYLLQAIGTARTLFSGQAGVLGSEVPQDAIIAVTKNEKSVAVMASVWNQIFKDHPHVKFFDEEGAHISLARRKAILGPLSRLIEAQIQLDRSGAIDTEKLWSAQKVKFNKYGVGVFYKRQLAA